MILKELDTDNKKLIDDYVKNNPDKHGKAYSQNYLFVDGHVSLLYLQSLAGVSGVDMFSTTDFSGTYFDCQD